MIKLFEDIPEYPQCRVRWRLPQTRTKSTEIEPTLYNHIQIAGKPITRQARLQDTLEERDPWGEWENPYSDDCLPILRALETLPADYMQSATFIRAYRPRGEASEALKWWKSPTPRAHLINALLLRGERSIRDVQEDLDIMIDKVYTYFPRWGVRYHMARADATLIDASGHRYEAEVESRDNSTRTGKLKVIGYQNRITARFDRMGGVWRTDTHLPTLAHTHVTVPVAALLLDWTEKGVKSVFTGDARTSSNSPLIRLEHIRKITPEQEWKVTLQEALTLSNPCRCIFWDHHQHNCGLGNPVPFNPPTCEDHDPL